MISSLSLASFLAMGRNPSIRSSSPYYGGHRYKQAGRGRSIEWVSTTGLLGTQSHTHLKSTKIIRLRIWKFPGVLSWWGSELYEVGGGWGTVHTVSSFPWTRRGSVWLEMSRRCTERGRWSRHSEGSRRLAQKRDRRWEKRGTWREKRLGRVQKIPYPEVTDYDTWV